MKVESKNKYVEIPFYLEQAIRKIIIYKARNNTARKPGDNRSGKNVQKSQVQALIEIFLFADKKPGYKNNRNAESVYKNTKSVFP